MNHIDTESEQVPHENFSDQVADQSIRPPRKLTSSRLWTVVFLGALVLAITIVVLFLIPSTNIKSQSMSATAKNLLTTESEPISNIESQDELRPNHTPSSDLDFAQKHSNSKIHDNRQVVGLLNETNLKVTNINERLLALNQHFENLEPIEAQLALILMKQNEITGELNARISNLQASIDVLSNQISIESMPEMELSNEAPPFQLVSIDLWNNTWYAVLELEGIITMIEPNAVRAGWQLINVDPPSQSANFLSDSGKEVRLTVKG